MFNRTSRLKSSLVLGLACTVAFILAMLVTSLLVKSRTGGLSGSAADGFDFKTDSENNASAGPEAGARIDLTRLKMRDGVSLASIAHQRLIMLVTVDPQCGACKFAADEMRDIRDRVKPRGVEYHPVSFTSSATASQSSPEFFLYAYSLGLSESAFLWTTGGEPPPEKLFLMVLPSHILIDANGVVVRKWPGTDRSPRVRHKMANQIVADTLDEIERLAR